MGGGLNVGRREPPYEIKLTKNRRFVFDYEAERGLYRVSWYERRRQPCPVCHSRGIYRIDGANLGLCKECHGNRFVWPMTRTTGTSAELADAIAAARGEGVNTQGERLIPSPSLDTVFLADYIFSTDWGARLPRAKPWPPFDASLLASEAETRTALRERLERMPAEEPGRREEA